MRTTLNESVHDKLVESLAAKYKSDGYYVQADHIGHTNGSPKEFGGYIPDIYATKGIEKIIAEAETSDTISDDHTRQQLSTFARYASLHVIVPQASLSEAQNQAKQWGIKVDKWWYL
jgi:hypothetical protein